ncbi:tRNA (adenosine(37)-N6)-threonylcarbamoyltransferase complex transferase subunit TsaD [Edaphobacter sp. 4G125]|nr:tRNA (adenosine(37)-N6)-threonylcarbamoyltransferase complex transferase subunit TsaD [Edaphobacter sp. 4G125]QNI38678.1 tRNA (adenosine(37)-N6)-threonylcarbamoyltransferase complex transferase subunit TsaD [Edaphobacter sp. 4G125]
MRDLSQDGKGSGLGSGLILGIESSCDETAAAVVHAGTGALSNVVASQMDLHANYGGVVPELASREHLRNVVPVVRAAMEQAGVSFEELDAIAVTEGPGLAGALLVGITYAKALSFGLGKPLIGVNHLEGHIHAVLMEAGKQVSESAKLLALVVSGGHTHLYLAEQAGDLAEKSAAGVWRYCNVGRTVDDAAGEAYDKVAKLLGLGYPGGPWIDALSRRGNPHAVPFRFAQIKPRAHREGVSLPNKKAPARSSGPSFDFSFSGIKTAVLRYVETHHMRESIEARRRALAEHSEWRPGSDEAAALCDQQTLDLIASFQYAVVGNLLRQAFAAAEMYGAEGIVVSGGVAANSELRRRFQSEADRRGLPVAFPSLALSTDNAAMIAAAAWPKFVSGEFAPETLGATPQLRLGGK